MSLPMLRAPLTAKCQASGFLRDGRPKERNLVNADSGAGMGGASLQIFTRVGLGSGLAASRSEQRSRAHWAHNHQFVNQF